MIDQLIRCRRRSIGLTITQDAQLIVRAPHWMSPQEIERVINQKQRWINEKQALLRQRLLQKSALPKITLQEEYLLKQKAFDHISQRAKELAQTLGITYGSLRINNAKTRWGSCSHKGNLNLTWRLIMAPARVIDYVIVHELTHLKEMNHSARFWAEIAKIIPDYKNDERWLKEHGHNLRF